MFDKWHSALCTSKNVVVVGLSQSEISELYIILSILSLVRRLPCILPSYWYILHILWLRFPDSLPSHWYILSFLVVPIAADLATWYLLPGANIIVEPSFQMTHVILDIRDTSQPSLSLVWYLGRDNGFKTYVDSNEL